MTDSSTCKRRILIVDDDALVCETVILLLKIDGHVTDAATSGRQALALFQPGKFDLVITDFLMPAMTGDQLAAAIKLRAPNQPIALLTAYAERFRTPAMRLSTVDFVIDKPIPYGILRDTINGLAPAQNPNPAVSQN